MAIAGVELIDTSIITELTLCRSVRLKVSFPLQRRLGIQNMERSGSLARRSNSLVHEMISIRWGVCVLLYFVQLR